MERLAWGTPVERGLLVAAALSATLWAYACGDGATEPSAPPPDPPRPTSVMVTPATAQLGALGATVQLTAEVRDQNGQAMAGAAVTWASGSAAVATVSGSGLVTAAGNGTATITATAGSASGTATVTVAQEVSAVTVSPAADTLLAGDTLRLVAEAADANGHAVPEADFSWASSDTLVAVVDDAGLVTGVGAGEVEVTATAAGVTGRAGVTVVAPAPTTVAVTPDTLALTAIGQTARLTAEVRDQAGRAMAGVPVSWSSADTTVAAVDSAGLVSAAGSGTTTITATADSASGEAVVTVMQPAGSVVVSPPADTVAPGDTLRLAAEAFDDNGHRVEGAQFAWSSSDASVARVDGSGLVTGVAEGTAMIGAMAGDAQGTAQVTVENPDRAALVALYNATDGPNWVNNDNWLTDAPLGDWYGVDTDASGRVVRLDLSGRWDSEARRYMRHGLSGSIPRELGDLLSLNSLRLSHNHLTGPIPSELGDLVRLNSLALNSNQLDGRIPAELGKLASLNRLILSNNRLTGPIPPEVGDLARLSDMELWNNELTGPIPRELGNLANLRSLDLNGNGLSGRIPSELGDLPSLAWLDLGTNGLSGPIPPELGDLANLTSLSLRWNNFAGPIPSELGNLTNLTSLSLWNSNLTGPIPPELGNLTSLESLGLAQNNLTGPVPSELGDLTSLTNLFLGGNNLTDPIPESLRALDALERFEFEDNAGLCAPGTTDFFTWLAHIEGASGPYCNESDAAVLELLYNASEGTDWTNSGGWLDTPVLKDWHGVEANPLGRVVALDLTANGLVGRLPAGLGGLADMTKLRVGDNALSGRLPVSLAQLPLVELHYADTDLCVPAESSFGSWLNGIASHEGTSVECTTASLSDREILVTLYETTQGPNWINAFSWLTDAPLGDWHGVETDASGRVVSLSLYENNLTGTIPTELGNLTNLKSLELSFNKNLSGPIPPDIGRLSQLEALRLRRTGVSGRVPAEFGMLANLRNLALGESALSGPLPPELGKLVHLELLSLDQNHLTGSIPPELGHLANLRELRVARNAGLSGTLPASLTALRRLEVFVTGGTSLCAPANDGFMTWLAAIRTRWVASCVDEGQSIAYLTQAVQSREYPVSLVAGEQALLRVFVTTARTTTAGIPPVRARFFVNGTQKHVANIPAKTTPIPTDVDEGDLSKSANAEIPAEVIEPGLEIVIEIDPEGTLDSGLGVATRIPETGRMAVHVRELPVFDLTIVPFLWSADPVRAVVEAAEGMAADPEDHELLWATRTLLPIGALDMTAHAPVLSASNDPHDLLAETEAIRVIEGGLGHHMGMISGRAAPQGLAQRPGRASFSITDPVVIAHELGHNMSLSHAPCGNAGGTDPSYPYPDGSTGASGYDFRDGGGLVPPGTPDVMSYCDPDWISAYNFAKALRYRLFDEGPGASAAIAASTRSLLVWGGVNADSVPFLEPAFVIDAPAALPDSPGEYVVTGATANGGPLFSLSFTMPEVADGDGSSSFAFVLPVQPGWDEDMASLTLSGPGGSFSLDGESDLSMAILRNPRNGQVRGILRDLPPLTRAAADAVGQGVGTGLEVLFSRGLPDAEAWRR